VDSAKLRPDITEGRPGVPLRLRIALVDAKTCMPLENAAVDIWHCDAAGVYSGFTSMGSGGGPGGRGRSREIDETRFLRGVQLSGKQGIVDFTTIYPGWYQGRTIHIHLKVHWGGKAVNETYGGGHVAHTGQLFLPEDITADVAKMAPYASHSGVHRTLQGEDMIFRSQHGSAGLMTLERLSKGTNAGGFLATATVADDPEDLADADAVRGRSDRGEDFPEIHAIVSPAFCRSSFFWTGCHRQKCATGIVWICAAMRAACPHRQRRRRHP
jgi:protocatechuate 3,4-dioxygenase beta subunit